MEITMATKYKFQNIEMEVIYLLIYNLDKRPNG